MKKYLILFLLAFFAMSPIVAQRKDGDRKSKHEMMKELHEFKLKFLAQEMDLKEDQQTRFFEIYNQMSEERHKLFRETRQLEKKVKENKNASDADYQAVSAAITAAKEKDAALEKKYDEKFSTFLSQKQIFKMKAAEEKFREKMREMRQRKK